ncbi:N-acetylglucosamine-6-phosphate deacetylase [Leptolyngbya ohadii]|uniref:N-acetylglucosamine-6-phosphate deacetylase n=1 Tax=Leptolyngbya ohadii TaxID=1962290 RepID=UPI000B598DFA|nr:N-acetylglucosamine-6-phosphate deacetylase [Leptolyngbya ohadii]
MLALTNATIYTKQAVYTDRTLLIDRDRIVDLIPAETLPEVDAVIDLHRQIVAPGFIDLQLNGCGGVMFNDAITAETLDTMHQTNLKSGTTSFLPTLITTSDDNIRAAIDLVKSYRKTHATAVLGLHLEGPFLNPQRKGIHDGSYVRAADRTMLETIAASGKETVRLVTLAPERVTPQEIKLLTDRGIVVSAGHTDATYEEAIAQFEAGVGMATHLFNAMSPWQGRKPGMVGAVFDRPEVYAGIIADGHHVHFASIALAHRLKQDKLILVTDATPPVGTDMTSFIIGGNEVFYRDGKCVSADGTLGGSALTMIEAVANCVQHIQIPIAEALRMASTYPAQLLGLDGKLGDIAPGYVANLAIFDQQFQMGAVIDRGWFYGLR